MTLMGQILMKNSNDYWKTWNGEGKGENFNCNGQLGRVNGHRVPSRPAAFEYLVSQPSLPLPLLLLLRWTALKTCKPICSCRRDEKRSAWKAFNRKTTWRVFDRFLRGKSFAKVLFSNFVLLGPSPKKLPITRENCATLLFLSRRQLLSGSCFFKFQINILYRTMWFLTLLSLKKKIAFDWFH